MKHFCPDCGNVMSFLESVAVKPEFSRWVCEVCSRVYDVRDSEDRYDILQQSKTRTRMYRRRVERKRLRRDAESGKRKSGRRCCGKH